MSRKSVTFISMLLLLALLLPGVIMAQDQVTIDFWIPGGRGRDQGTAAVIEAFEAQNPNINVEADSDTIRRIL